MNKHSRVCANIDLSAIMHNMEAMHQNIDPNTKIMVMGLFLLQRRLNI